MTAELIDLVEKARAEFESQWRPSDLNCVDQDFFDRFERQSSRWDLARVTGTLSEMDTQGKAMIRAYAAACDLMKRYRHTAYLLGYDREEGVAVCISAHSEAVEHAQRSIDVKVEWVTPEAVAGLVGASRRLQTLVEDKEDRLS